MARALTITESNEERDGVGDDGCTIDFLQEHRASSSCGSAKTAWLLSRTEPRIVLPVVLPGASILRRALNPKASRPQADRPPQKMSVCILLRFRRRRILEKLGRLWPITFAPTNILKTRIEHAIELL